ncbi:MAG: hypothetical protein AABW41_03410 [Nanoarchaeota archaeon]
MVNQKIVDFIKNALQKGYSEDYIIKGLKAKNWPLNLINEAIATTKSQMSPQKIQQQAKTEVPKQTQQIIKPQPKELKLEAKPLQIAQQKPTSPKISKPISFKQISLYALLFLGIFVLLTFTILVYFYMNGTINYEIQDPSTGTKYNKSCIQEDCSDLRAFALDSVRDKFVPILISGFILSGLIIIVYKLIPLNWKKIFFWIINGMYFLFLLIMAFIWIKFSSS